MRNLGILIKNNINCMFGAFQGKKKRRNIGLVISIFTIAYLAICTCVGFQFYSLFSVMSDLREIPLYNSLQVVLMMALILSFQTISGKSKTNDGDLLLSMPIKKIDIVLSKSISKYLLALMFEFLIVLPTIVLYSIYFGFSITVILWLLVIMLLFACISVGLSYIFDFLIVRVFNRFKFSGFLKTMLVLVVFGVFMFFYIKSSFSMGLITIETVDDFLAKNFFVGWCVKIVTRNDFLCLLWIVLISLTVLSLGLTLYALIFGKSYLAYKPTKKDVKYTSNGTFKTLIKKELVKLFTTPIYVVNAIIGPILLVVAGILLMVFSGKVESFLSYIADAQNSLFSIVILVCLLMCAMTQVSCVSVSLEGRYLWLLRSTPIDTRQVIIAKVLPNMLLFVPIHLILAICVGIVYKASLLIMILYILLPIILNVIISFGGVYINILLPKLDWDNETSVVKNSLSMIVNMFVGIILSIVPVVLNLCKLDIYLIGYITLGLYVALAITVIILLFTQGVKKFNKLKC